MANAKPTIPEIREMMHQRLDEMRALAVSGDVGARERLEIEAWCERFEELIEATKRRSPVRVAPKRRAPLTDEEVAAVRRYAKANPYASQQEMAVRFKTNPGRISEALAGYRDGRDAGGSSVSMSYVTGILPVEAGGGF